jgi:hypothetical protein
MSAHILLHRLTFSSFCSLLLTAVSYPQEVTHKISFTFDYNFAVTPACTPEVTKACVQQFNFYEISRGIPNRVKLGSIPVPTGARGLLKGISATTEPFLFDSGKHRVAVAAQAPDGSESNLRDCSIIVQIP